MPDICVSKNLAIVGGKLGLAQWSVPTHVFDQLIPAVGDGNYTRLDALPGKTMVDASVSWTNDAPVARNVLIRIQRPSRIMRTASPNAVQIRDRSTYKIGGLADIPDPSQTLQSQSGVSVDVSTNWLANPLPGRTTAYRPSTMSEEWVGPVPPGIALSVRYRCILWTPPPWADNANFPTYNAFVQGVRIQMIAFPTPDDEVFG